jgi:hypothetical protein
MTPRERRELIAAHVLSGLLASDAGERTMSRQDYYAFEPDKAALIAVELADALIKRLDATEYP